MRVAVLRLDDDQSSQEAVRGLREGLDSSPDGGGTAPAGGFEFEIVELSAHGSVTAIAPLVEEGARGAAAVLTVSTAALSAALRVADTRPVIFTALADPNLAPGYVRPSFFQRWLPLLFAPPRPPSTGAVAETDFPALLDIVGRVIEDPGPIGAVYAAGDPDSLHYRDALLQAAQRLGRDARTRAVADAGGVPAAAASLCSDGCRAFVALGDRVTDAAIGSLVQTAQSCAVPLFGTLRSHADAGAVVTLARDVAGAARLAGEHARRVLDGHRASGMPVDEVRTAELIINGTAADRANVGIPLWLLQRADRVMDDNDVDTDED